MTNQNTQWDTLKKEFKEAWSANAIQKLTTNWNIFRDDIADWWLSKLKEDRAGLIEKVEGMKVDCEEAGYEMPTDPGLAADQSRNAALDIVLAILKS